MGLLDPFRRKEEGTKGEADERWQKDDKIENRYEIHKIKRGGFGIVYLCYDNENKEPVAIKTFQAKYMYSRKARDDFKGEALRWINLDKYKNIVKAYYVKNIENQPYIFLEYVAGGNLEDWLYAKMLDLPLALNFAVQFCNGMDYAYKKMGLIHRDIKPGNILLTMDKTIKITDFGLAKAREARTEEIEVPKDVSYYQSSNVGTLPYMAPEQLTGKEIDTRADIYAFGIVLYQMVAGSYPYPSKSSWMEMHLKEPPLPIKQEIPRELNIVISKCLEKEPSKRYQNFSELKAELSKIYFDLTGERIIEEPMEKLEVWELANKGASLGELGRYHEALACFDKVIEINPRSAEAWDSKGIALYELGRHQEALTCFDKALEINPRLAEAWYNKGKGLNISGRHQEALTCFDKALEINPRLAEAWGNKGNALDKLARHQEALACLDKVREINPRLVEIATQAGTWIDKGVTLENLGRHQEAVACYDKALEISPSYAKAWYNKGNALNILGVLQEALTCYDRALEINPVYTVAWGNKGNALNKSGRPSEALVCCDKALELNPRYAEAWHNKGVALEDLGRNREAIISYQKFIEFAPPQFASHVKRAKDTIHQLKGMI